MQINKKDTDTNHTNAPNFAVELTRLAAQQSNNIARAIHFQTAGPFGYVKLNRIILPGVTHYWV